MILRYVFIQCGFPGGSDSKESVCNVGDLGSIPGTERFPGEGNGNPLQYSCLENSMDRGAWQTTVHGVAKSQTQMNNFHSNFFQQDFRIQRASKITKNILIYFNTRLTRN